MISASISTEQFIGEVGFAYTAGLSVANWELGVFPAFMIMGSPAALPGPKTVYHPRISRTAVWERHARAFCRRHASQLCADQPGGRGLSRGPALHTIFGLPLYGSAILLTIITGSYAIYGGLASVAWTDVFQAALLLIGGLMVFFFGMSYVGWDWSAIVSHDLSRAHLNRVALASSLSLDRRARAGPVHKRLVLLHQPVLRPAVSRRTDDVGRLDGRSTGLLPGHCLVAVRVPPRANHVSH